MKTASGSVCTRNVPQVFERIECDIGIDGRLRSRPGIFLSKRINGYIAEKLQCH